MIAFEGALPRPHAALADADLEDAPVQGGPRAVRARGLPRAVRAGVPRARRDRGARGARARVRHAGRRRERRRDRDRAGAGRGRLRRRAARVPRRACARICDEHGIVFVVDEVQTGFGRTGRMFAIEHYDVEPDLMTVAKSIAAGLPLSGVIGKAEIMDAPGDSAIGGTYVGNPVAQAAALAVLDVFEEEGLVERARADRRARSASGCSRGRSAATAIGDVRGLGAMLAIELVRDRETKEPAPELASRGRRGGCGARPAAPEVRDLLELHPRARAARRSPTPSSTRRSASGRRRSRRTLARRAHGAEQVNARWSAS